MRGDLSRAAQTPSNSPASQASMICRVAGVPACFSRAGRKCRERCAGRWARGHAPRRRTSARTELSCFSTAWSRLRSPRPKPARRSRTRPRDPRRSSGDLRADRPSHVRRRTSSRPRRNAAEARPRQFSARRRRVPRAIEVAKQQGTRSFGLRAALALAKLYQSTGRPADAHAVLAPALEGFVRDRKCQRSRRRRRCWWRCRKTDEVKVEAAQRQRLTQLHVAYGNALLQARGYGAPEMTEAFARARESASGDKDAPGRLAADYGLWAGSYVRGELPSMRAHAAAFLSDVGASPDSPEAGSPIAPPG